jgi:hypothetical protein
MRPDYNNYYTTYLKLGYEINEKLWWCGYYIKVQVRS